MWFNGRLGELSCDVDRLDWDRSKGGLGLSPDTDIWVGGGELSDGLVATLAEESAGSGFFDVRLDKRRVRRDWLLDGGFRDSSVDR